MNMNCSSSQKAFISSMHESALPAYVSTSVFKETVGDLVAR